MPDLETILALLRLEPLPHEGGYFCETYRSRATIPPELLGEAYTGPRSGATAIYYLLTPESFSAMHRLPGDELFHFYMGDPVRMLQLHPDGRIEEPELGTDLVSGQRPQALVPAGTWQGASLVAGGSFALLGATMSPGFDFDDYEHGDPASLEAQFPEARARIRSLTRERQA